MGWRKYLSGTELILPVGFNSDLYCLGNKLTKIVLPEGFNSYLDCSGNKLSELVLPKGYNKNYIVDKSVKVYTYEEWLAMERERIMLSILND